VHDAAIDDVGDVRMVETSERVGLFDEALEQALFLRLAGVVKCLALRDLENE
jgi:hypothetical protein